MKPGNLRCCGEAGTRIELSPQGHEFALRADHDQVISSLEQEAQTLTGSPEVSLSCEAFRVAVSHRGAGMPPVVSWLRPSGDREHESFLLHLLPDQACFDGHFPGQAILPGVVQLHWAVQLAESCLGYPGPPAKILRLKYHNIAVPPRFVELQLKTTGQRQVEFRVLGPDCIHAQGKLVFEGED